MKKLIIFDLDGVLVDAKIIHYEALNVALGKDFEISWLEHLSLFDGLKTMSKLEMLTKLKGLPVTEYGKIWELKQEITKQRLEKLLLDEKLVDVFKYLKFRSCKIAVCSNSIRQTVELVLERLGLNDYIDFILSNEDVKFSKPHPEMYWRTMAEFGVLPEETLIIEDSPYGLKAAQRSGAHVFRVKGPDEITISNLENSINNTFRKHIDISTRWVDKQMNILIPMAGAGSRFSNAGYTFPKPLIDVNGKPMIQFVVENLNIDAHYIYIVQKTHREKYNLDSFLNLLTPNCTILNVDGLTEGAACTALVASDLINNDAPLFFANSDQFVEWDPTEFFYKMNETDADGGIPVFESSHPKWSFVRVDEYGLVTEVQEKNPISNLATVGFYYWKRGSDFIEFANQMISKNLRVNNEFYVCPVYNQAIASNRKIRIFKVNKMWGLGTPEDLNHFMLNYK
jgi:HAD superfamily hydrolase (TIGR01509 family)